MMGSDVGGKIAPVPVEPASGPRSEVRPDHRAESAPDDPTRLSAATVALSAGADRLRPGVAVSVEAETLRLNDLDTGFEASFLGHAGGLLDRSRPGSAELWASLHAMGFTSRTATLEEARGLQRTAFANATPPLPERLKDRLARICREVPYFGERAGAYQPGDHLSLEEFGRLPFLRKRDIRAHFLKMIPGDIDLPAGLEDGSLTVLSTSGSTDERLQVVSRTTIDRLPFGSADLLGVPIGGVQPRTAIFTTPICSSMDCNLAGAGPGRTPAPESSDLMLRSTDTPFSIPRDFVEEFCDELDRFRPVILAADPIYLQGLVRSARRFSIDLPKLPLVQRGFELGTRASQRDIGKAFATRVLNDYGASEENRLAIECQFGSLHVRCDAVHLEIVDRDGHCPPGKVGAVAVTTFDSLTPLIRYLIGDVAAWTGRACRCVYRDWPTIDLHGRSKDMMWFQGRWLTALTLDEALGAPDWLGFYRLSQAADGALAMDVIPSLGESVDPVQIRHALRDIAAIPEISIRTVKSLDPMPSMKIGTLRTKRAAPEMI